MLLTQEQALILENDNRPGYSKVATVHKNWIDVDIIYVFRQKYQLLYKFYVNTGKIRERWGCFGDMTESFLYQTDKDDIIREIEYSLKQK